jgi:hypothetical protein
VIGDYSVLAWGIPFMWFGVEVLKKARGRLIVEKASVEETNLLHG